MGGAGGGSLTEGVDTPLWLLTAPELAGTTGRYFYRRREEEPNPQVEDADARTRLWDLARALECSPTGDQQTPSLPRADPSEPH
jgi:hypothetical protein